MIRRLFWVSIGVTVGLTVAVVAAKRIYLTVGAVTKDGVGAQAAKAADEARGLILEVQELARAREAELREALLTPSARDAKGGSSKSDLSRPRSVPGGWRPEDEDEDLFEF